MADWQQMSTFALLSVRINKKFRNREQRINWTFPFSFPAKFLRTQSLQHFCVWMQLEAFVVRLKNSTSWRIWMRAHLHLMIADMNFISSSENFNGTKISASGWTDTICIIQPWKSLCNIESIWKRRTGVEKNFFADDS